MQGEYIVREKIQVWFLILLAGIYTVTIVFVQVFNYFINGKFDVSAVLGALTGALILSILNVIINLYKKKKH